MLSLEKTRVILDSKILKNLEECVIIFDFKNNINKIALKVTGTEKPISAKVLNFDSFLENNLVKDKETITWAEIICESITK